jgi:hypothetical protein
MKVKEVMRLLAGLPEDLEVLVASDDEGNSFRLVPENWVSVEKFDCNLNIIHRDDYSDYMPDDLNDYAVIG